MAMRKAVIAFDVGGISEMIDDGVSGALVRAPDEGALGQEEQDRVVPVVRGQRPAVTQHDGLTLAPVLIEDLGSV